MTKINLQETLKKLEDIARWFEQQKDVDVEKGLTKIKEAAELIKESKKRLVEVENEFIEIQKEIEEELDTDEAVNR
jgi:hypothetical protein